MISAMPVQFADDILPCPAVPAFRTADLARSALLGRTVAASTRPVTTLGTAGIKVRKKANVFGRWHDNRHTLVAEPSKSGARDEVIMSIAGHVSRAMLSRYSPVRMEATRRTLDEIAALQRAAAWEARARNRLTAGARPGRPSTSGDSIVGVGSVPLLLQPGCSPRLQPHLAVVIQPAC